MALRSGSIIRTFRSEFSALIAVVAIFSVRASAKSLLVVDIIYQLTRCSTASSVYQFCGSCDESTIACHTTLRGHLMETSHKDLICSSGTHIVIVVVQLPCSLREFMYLVGALKQLHDLLHDLRLHALGLFELLAVAEDDSGGSLGDTEVRLV